MTRDLIVYLSGGVPGGVYLCIGLVVLFTFIWLFTWTGTRFWTRRILWRVLGGGWLLILLLYVAVWVYLRPNPMPVRVIITTSPLDPQTPAVWRVRGITDLIERRLAESKRPIVPLDEALCPALKTERVESPALYAIAFRMRARWIIHLQPPDSLPGSTARVDILKRRGRRFKPVFSRSIGGGSFIAEAGEILASIDRTIGGVPADPPRYPPGVAEGVLEDFYRAFLLRDAGCIDSAAAVFAALKTARPDWPRPGVELARTRIQHAPGTRYDEVRGLLIRALKLDDQDPIVYRLLGRHFLEFHQWREAESALKLAFNYRPDDPRTLFYLSRLSDSRLKDLPWRSPRRILEEALHLAPGYETARQALAKRLIVHRNPQRALKLLETGLKINPRSTQLLITQSAAFIEMSRFPEAETVCRRLLSIDPHHSAALYNLGIALLWQERFDEGIAAFDSSYHLGGTDDNLYYIGLANERLGNWETAVKFYQLRLNRPHSAGDRAAVAAKERIQALSGLISRHDDEAEDSASENIATSR